MAIRTFPTLLLVAAVAVVAAAVAAPVPTDGAPVPLRATAARIGGGAALPAAAAVGSAAAAGGGRGAPPPTPADAGALGVTTVRRSYYRPPRYGPRSAPTPTPTPAAACIADVNACTCRLSAPDDASSCVDAPGGGGDYCKVRPCAPSYVCDCRGDTLCSRKRMTWKELACTGAVRYGFCQCDVVSAVKEMIQPMGA